MYRKDEPVLGAVLAGGRSRRMNGPDKRFLKWNNTSLLSNAVTRASSQVSQLVISTCTSLPEAAQYDLPIIQDVLPGHQGPAAGIISAYRWAKQQNHPFQWLMTFASDTPLFPLDLVSLLKQTAENLQCDVVIPTSQGHHHYAFALWSWSAIEQLEPNINAGERAIKQLISTIHYAFLPVEEPAIAFFNVNTQEDWTWFCQHKST